MDQVYEPANLEVTKARYEQLKARFVEAFGSEPDFYVRAPGRVNLIGEHIDYHGYAPLCRSLDPQLSYSVLPMAIANDVVMAVSACDNTENKPEFTVVNLVFPPSLPSFPLRKRTSMPIPRSPSIPPPPSPPTTPGPSTSSAATRALSMVPLKRHFPPLLPHFLAKEADPQVLEGCHLRYRPPCCRSVQLLCLRCILPPHRPPLCRLPPAWPLPSPTASTTLVPSSLSSADSVSMPLSFSLIP